MTNDNVFCDHYETHQNTLKHNFLVMQDTNSEFYIKGNSKFIILWHYENNTNIRFYSFWKQTKSIVFPRSHKNNSNNGSHPQRKQLYII
jgi:hypothetical protein